MTTNANPFIISGYAGPEYFCDRAQESAKLIQELQNGNNVALISPRRMGKTGLIQHCFQKEEFADYYTFFIDIYATKSLREMVFAMSKTILEALKPKGKKALETFVDYIKSLQPGISFDLAGNPTFNLQLGDIHQSENTLDEIFKYLEAADRPCIVAIDEFQQIAAYPETNIEALLRTYVQRSTNANFIFAGSQRHIMGNMFTSPSRPFYQSVSMMQLGQIDIEKYSAFAAKHFSDRGKTLAQGVVEAIWEQFDGITWYVQKMLNALFSMTPNGETCEKEAITVAINDILASLEYAYSETLFRLPEKQKELLIAISKASEAKNITSSAFIKTYGLGSASSVQAAIRVLLEKDYVTLEQGVYRTYDRFLAQWINRTY